MQKWIMIILLLMIGTMPAQADKNLTADIKLSNGHVAVIDVRDWAKTSIVLADNLLKKISEIIGDPHSNEDSKIRKLKIDVYGPAVQQIGNFYVFFQREGPFLRDGYYIEHEVSTTREQFFECVELLKQIVDFSNNLVEFYNDNTTHISEKWFLHHYAEKMDECFAIAVKKPKPPSDTILKAAITLLNGKTVIIDGEHWAKTAMILGENLLEKIEAIEHQRYSNPEDKNLHYDILISGALSRKLNDFSYYFLTSDFNPHQVDAAVYENESSQFFYCMGMLDTLYKFYVDIVRKYNHDLPNYSEKYLMNEYHKQMDICATKAILGKEVEVIKSKPINQDEIYAPLYPVEQMKK